MVRRYTTGPYSEEYVTYASYQAMRRRLAAKLCRERKEKRDRDHCYYHSEADFLEERGHYESARECARKAERARRAEKFFSSLWLAVSSGEPLAYFQRLGEVK